MPELMLVNPHKRRRRKSKAVKATKRRKYRRLKTSARRKFRRKSKALRAIRISGVPNPKRRRIRRYSRNPISMGGFVRNNLMPAAVGAGGALGLDVLLGFATPYLPAMVTTGPARSVLRLAGAVGIGMLATQFAGRKVGEQVMLGAVTVTVYDVLKGLVRTMMPTLALGDAEELGYYSPGMPVGEYVPEQLSEYVSSDMGEYVAGIGENEYDTVGEYDE